MPSYQSTVQCNLFGPSYWNTVHCTMLLFGFLCQAIGIQCNLFGPSFWNTVQCYFFCFFAQLSEYNVTYFKPSFQRTMQLIWAKLSEFILVQCTLYNATFGVSLPSNWNTMLPFGFLCQAIGIQCYLLGFFAKLLAYLVHALGLQCYFSGFFAKLSKYSATF